MQLRLCPTEQFFQAGDFTVRMWQGFARRDGAIDEPVVALIAAVTFTGQAEAIAEGLVSIPPPDEQSARKWAETVLAGGADNDK